jgi:hypothetical protein
VKIHIRFLLHVWLVTTGIDFSRKWISNLCVCSGTHKWEIACAMASPSVYDVNFKRHKCAHWPVKLDFELTSLAATAISTIICPHSLLQLNWQRIGAIATTTTNKLKMNLRLRLTCIWGNPSCSCTTGRGKGNRVAVGKCHTATRPSGRSTPTPSPIWRLRNKFKKKRIRIDWKIARRRHHHQSSIEWCYNKIKVINGAVRSPKSCKLA